MPKPSKPAPGYVSPVLLAGDILARIHAGKRVTRQAQSTARRITALPTWVASKLETHKVPYRVARWVAWGKKTIELEQRADLAVLLRRSRPSKGWPDARHLKVAFEVFLQSRAGRLGGLVSDVPFEQYTDAIAALPKRRRVANQRPAAEESTPAPVIVGEDDVLRALTETRRRRRPLAPAIKLRTIPLRTGAKSPLVDVEGVKAENARLRAQRESDELEAERHRDAQRREIARLTVKIELLEREQKARAGKPPQWLVGVGGVAIGVLASTIVRSGVELTEAANARAEDGAQVPSEQPIAPGNTASGALDGEALFKRLVPVFDNLSRAQRHAEEGAPVAAIAEGLRMVLGQLDEALAQSGVDRVPTVGHVFDPARHAAVEHVEAPEPAGVVLREVLPGYVAGGRLLRAPSVVVSKGLLNEMARSTGRG